MTKLRQAARRLKLGPAARLVYHRPVGLLRQSILEGGPLEQRRTAAGHAEMTMAASSLPALAEPPEGPAAAEVAFLSGANYWHQTIFCFVSLQLVSSFKISPIVFDDGNLTDESRALMRRVIPWVRFVDTNEIEDKLDHFLPTSSFPALRTRRREYPHLRKLTDIHIAASGFTLVMDSDMLFFREPHAILNWFINPCSIYMQDVETAYGYPIELLCELADGPIPERVNVGLYGLNSARLDWDRMERWCRQQIEHCGPHYLQEQALTAMAFVGAEAMALPRSDYIVRPDLVEGWRPTAVLHHYVAQSKRSYFQHGWRLILGQHRRENADG